jgi:hypothetical protein
MKNKKKDAENKSPATQTIDQMMKRQRELMEAGIGTHQAFAFAELESRFEQWPSNWGDDLQILIYGDFRPPEQEVRFEGLKITVYPENLRETKENLVIKSALTVLRALVGIDEKSVAALDDAAKRINVLLGAFILVGWASGACGWWSHVTHRSMGGS